MNCLQVILYITALDVKFFLRIVYIYIYIRERERERERNEKYPEAVLIHI